MLYNIYKPELRGLKVNQPINRKQISQSTENQPTNQQKANQPTNQQKANQPINRKQTSQPRTRAHPELADKIWLLAHEEDRTLVKKQQHTHEIIMG